MRIQTGSTPPRWELYRLLSEPVRLRLLALAAEEELAIGELAELLGESQPNISRHAAPLRQAGLLAERKEGTRTFLQLAEASKDDPVVVDAVESGRSICQADGSLGRVAAVVSGRDIAVREFFSRSAEASFGDEVVVFAPEIGAYLSALSPLLPRRDLAVDVGTGDGRLLDVLAPLFKRVLAVDRAEAQLARAKRRVELRGYTNVEWFQGELDATEVHRRVGKGADAVFASRLLHHAPRPGVFIKILADLCAPGGALIVLDYADHDDDAMQGEADVWLGFEPSELCRFAREAGLPDAKVTPISPGLRGTGVDAHLPWQVMVALKTATPIDAKPLGAAAETKPTDIRRLKSALGGRRE